jgi:hypothetical protein
MKIKKRYFILMPIGLITTFLISLRFYDYLSDRKEWIRLANFQPSNPISFDLKMVSGLPEPAQRFFKFAIKEGTPLLTVAEIDMGGKFSLGSKEDPNYQEMEAYQILASPEGFLWRLNLRGFMPISGSDTGKWTRFRILKIIPVARMGDNPDHTKAAFGRYVAESVFWTPAAVLPNENIKWEKVDNDSARVTISSGNISQEVVVKVDAAGCPVLVSFQRWSNANKDKVFRLQPFGGKLSDFREVQGFTIPFKVEAANLFGTIDEFYFFKADVKDIRFMKK